MAKKGVSIIICCYNSSSRITTTLNHLQKINSQGIPWEVILVDNASTDDTSAKSKMVWEANPVTGFLLVEEQKKGLMNARIKGVASSSFDFISFIDDDNWIEEDWIHKVFTILNENPEIAACGGSVDAVFESTPPPWFSEFSVSYATGMQQNMSGFVQPQKGYLWGAGLTIRKQAWAELFSSGFSSLLSGRSGKALTAGEDSEICLAFVIRGWKLWYEESLKLQHYIPAFRLKLDYLLRMYEGFGKAEVILSLYRGLIDKKLANKSSWLFQCLSSLKKLLRAGLKNVFSTPNTKVRHMALWKLQKGYSLEIITNRNKYLSAEKRINTFFTPH